jgi:hypothetical protein
MDGLQPREEQLGDSGRIEQALGASSKNKIGQKFAAMPEQK